MKEIENIEAAVAKLANSDILKAMTLVRDTLEHTDLFPIAHTKALIAREKRKYFHQNGFKKVILISSFNNYDYAAPKIKEIEIKKIDYKDVTNTAFDVALLAGAFVLLTNNTINRIGIDKFIRLYARTPNTVYAVQDIDSHHWHELSLLLAAISDIYIQGHPGSTQVHSRINDEIITGIPIGTTQWSRGFIERKVSDLDKVIRVDEAFGMHSYYPRFNFRNRVVRTVEKSSPYVRLQTTSETNSFLSADEESRWNIWTKYKLHWIIPVAADYPNRLFDALITGGLPLVPKSQLTQLEALGISAEDICCYDSSDLLDLTPFLRHAIEKYKRVGGASAAKKRALFACEKFHIDYLLSELAVEGMSRYC